MVAGVEKFSTKIQMLKPQILVSFLVEYFSTPATSFFLFYSFDHENMRTGGDNESFAPLPIDPPCFWQRRYQTRAFGRESLHLMEGRPCSISGQMDG